MLNSKNVNEVLKEEKFKKLVRKEFENYQSHMEFLSAEIEREKDRHIKALNKIHKRCEKNGGHKDDGGFFYAKCKFCGLEDRS